MKVCSGPDISSAAHHRPSHSIQIFVLTRMSILHAILFQMPELLIYIPLDAIEVNWTLS